MKLKYMIDSITRNVHAEEGRSLEAVGVWITDGEEIRMFYKKIADHDIFERISDSDDIKRIIKKMGKRLPKDFMEYHCQSRSMYNGTFAFPKEEEFESFEECAKSVLEMIGITDFIEA